MPAKCGWSALKARLARELLPWKGWRNFVQVRAKAKLVWTLPSAAEIHLVISEGNSSRPCVWVSRINFAAERQGRRRWTSESMFGLFFSGNMADSSCKRLRQRRRRCQEQNWTIRSLFFVDYTWLYTHRGQWYSFDTGCVWPRKPWPRPRRSTRRPRCRRSSRGRYRVSARKTSVPPVGYSMWLTYSIYFSLWQRYVCVVGWQKTLFIRVFIMVLTLFNGGG